MKKFHGYKTKLEIIHSWMVVLYGQKPIAQAISLEKFCGYRSNHEIRKTLSTLNDLQYMVYQKSCIIVYPCFYLNNMYYMLCLLYHTSEIIGDSNIW